MSCYSVQVFHKLCVISSFNVNVNHFHLNDEVNEVCQVIVYLADKSVFKILADERHWNINE